MATVEQVCHYVWEWQNGKQRCFRCGEIVYRGPSKTALERGWWTCRNVASDGATEEEILAAASALPEGRVPCDERSWHDAFVHILGSEQDGHHQCKRCGNLLRAQYDPRSEGLDYVQCIDKSPGEEAVLGGGTINMKAAPEHDIHGHELEICMSAEFDS